MAGAGDDIINTDDILTGTNENGTVTSNNNDTNDKVVIDGGDGNDTVTFGKDMSEYTISVDDNTGYITVIENSDSDSDGNGIGDVTELRNVETIEFADTNYNIAPIAQDDEITIEVESSAPATIDTNIILTLDLSGSMNWDGDQETSGVQSRLEIAKDAIENMIEAYDGMGEAHVYLTTFSSSGTSSGWMNADEAISTIDNLIANGLTNYEDAVYETYSNFTDIPAADNTVGFFISDGEPTKENYDGSNEQRGWLDDTYKDAWTQFVETNMDELNVVGIGTGINDTTYLDMLAEADQSVVTVNTFVVKDLSELESYLVPTQGKVIDALGNDTDPENDQLSIIAIDGQDVTDGKEATITDENGNVLGTATLNHNGEIDFVASEYTTSLDDGSSVSFEYTVSDGDKTDTANITVNVEQVVDTEVSVPTLNMDIGDAIVTTTSTTSGTGNSTSVFDDISLHTTDGMDLDHDIDYNGHEDQTVNINNFNGNASEVELGSGDDKVSVKYSVNGKEIETGSGDDTLVIGGSADHSEIDMGQGDDRVQIDGNIGSSVKLGSGDDSIQISGNANFNSNNTDQSGRPIIDGGSGNDSLYFTGNSSDYVIVDSTGNTISLENYATQNANGTGNSSNSEFKIYKVGQSENQALIVKNIENLVFEGDNSGVAISTTYEYPITLNAEVTDTSETLSSITIDNLPDGTTLKDSDGNEMTANENGSYTVDIDDNGDASVTLVSSEEVAQEDLSTITSSITATESNGGDSISVDNSDNITELDGGTDETFTVDFDNIELDFDNISATNVETLDLGLGDDNNINVTNLDINDVLSMTDDHELTIFGDEGDTVSLDKDVWTQGEDVEGENGEVFSTFTGGGDNGLEQVQLMIDSHVDVVQG